MNRIYAFILAAATASIISSCSNSKRGSCATESPLDVDLLFVGQDTLRCGTDSVAKPRIISCENIETSDTADVVLWYGHAADVYINSGGKVDTLEITRNIFKSQFPEDKDIREFYLQRILEPSNKRIRDSIYNFVAILTRLGSDESYYFGHHSEQSGIGCYKRLSDTEIDTYLSNIDYSFKDKVYVPAFWANRNPEEYVRTKGKKAKLVIQRGEKLDTLTITRDILEPYVPSYIKDIRLYAFSATRLNDDPAWREILGGDESCAILSLCMPDTDDYCDFLFTLNTTEGKWSIEIPDDSSFYTEE